MKRIPLFLLLVVADCRRENPLPGEVSATVVSADGSKCGFCGGWFVDVNTIRYRANVPAPFANPNTPVWIRFLNDEGDELKRLGNWIEIRSIRAR